MSRIYNPPTSSTSKGTSSTTRMTSSNNVFGRANSVAVTTNKEANKMTRQQSAVTTASGYDPLRLVKVDMNPLAVQAKQTLTLLEQQNEWKNERRKEIAEGKKESPPVDGENWESSLSKWKNRRQSEPFYQPKVLDLVVDKIETDKIDVTQNSSKKINGRESLSKLRHQWTYDDDTSPHQSNLQSHQHQQQQQQQQPVLQYERTSRTAKADSTGSEERQVPSDRVPPRETTQREPRPLLVTSVTSSLQDVNKYGLTTVPKVEHSSFSSTTRVTVASHTTTRDNVLTSTTPVTSALSGDRHTTVSDIREENRPAKINVVRKNNDNNNETKNNVNNENNDDRRTMNCNEQLTSKQDVDMDLSRPAGDEEKSRSLLIGPASTDSDQPTSTLQWSRDDTQRYKSHVSDVTIRSDDTDRKGVAVVIETDTAEGRQSAADRSRDHFVNETCRVPEGHTQPEVLGQVPVLESVLVDITPSSLTSPPPDSPPPLPSAPPPSLRWSMFPSTANETTEFDYDIESPFGSPVNNVAPPELKTAL